MNTGILLAIVSATAALTTMTSSIGVGIFLQHANAAPGGSNSNGATQFKGFVCGLGPAGTTTESHEVVTPSGNENEQCHA